MSGEQARAEQKALRESEVRYRSLFESISKGFFVVEVLFGDDGRVADARLLKVNPAFEKHTGLCGVEGKRMQELELEHDERWSEIYGRVARTGQPAHFVGEASPALGRVYDVHAYPVGGPAETKIAILFEDVTERERAKAELERSERRLRSVVENVRDIIFRVDLEGRYTFLNPVWEEVMGYPVGASLGTPFETYVCPEEREACREKFQRHLSSAGAETQGYIVSESHFVTAGGNLRWMRLSTRLLRDETGAVVGTTGTITDLTGSKGAEAERKAREHAEELSAAKATFLGNMSHELRTPLTSILGYAELLAEERAGSEQQAFAKYIVESGQRLMSTLDSVLQLTRLDARGGGLSMEPVPVAEVVQETAETRRSTAEKKGLAFAVEVSPTTEAEEAGLARAMLNEGALGRVLDTLIGNAIKFTEEGGWVTVRAEVRGGEVVLQVEDTGIGIGEAFQAEGLFEEFRQESTGTSRTHEGTGLGLAVARRLVQRMGGQIEVESAKGEGTTFTVRFPRVADAPPAGETRMESTQS